MLILLLLVGVSAPAPDPPVTDRAWTSLKQGLAETNVAKRAKAVHALGLAGRRTEAMAEKALTDPDKEVRSEAAIALLQMNALSARPKLRECLKDKEIQVVLACANTLYEFKDPAAYEIYYAVFTGHRRSTEGLLESQLDTLHNRKQMEKLAFETGIGFVPFGGPAWQAIKTVTHDDSSPIRAMAALRLADDSKPDSAIALANFAHDKKPQVRDAVIRAIVRRGDPALTNTVETLLYDDDDTVRYDSAAAVIYLSGLHPVKHKTR